MGQENHEGDKAHDEVIGCLCRQGQAIVTVEAAERVEQEENHHVGFADFLVGHGLIFPFSSFLPR